MAQNEKTIFVYENWHGVEPIWMGTLRVSFLRGQEMFSLNVSENDCSIDLSLALSVAEYFGLTREHAAENMKQITEIVKSNWVRLAERYRLGRSAIEYMRPAFLEK